MECHSAKGSECHSELCSEKKSPLHLRELNGRNEFSHRADIHPSIINFRTCVDVSASLAVCLSVCVYGGRCISQSACTRAISTDVITGSSNGAENRKKVWKPLLRTCWVENAVNEKNNNKISNNNRKNHKYENIARAGKSAIGNYRFSTHAHSRVIAERKRVLQFH